MSLVYSPRLGRYVHGFRAQSDYINRAYPARGISPLAAMGTIESYTFPTSAETGKEATWACDVHNVGTEGQVAFGIVNIAGNPGNIVVTREGKETVLEPSIYYRFYTIGPVPNCYHLMGSGTVRFEAEGTYNVLLWGMHEEGGVWYYDHEIPVSVTVQQSWPITKQEQVFFNTRLAPGTFAESNKTKTKLVDTPKVLGGRIDFTVKFEEATIPGCTTRIYWNEELIFYKEWWPWEVGKTVSGSFDLPLDKIRADNALRIHLHHVPATFNVCVYNAYVVLGYSEEPAIDPPWTPGDWLEWLKKNAMWIALGGTGLFAVYLFTRRGPPVIVIPVGAQR